MANFFNLTLDTTAPAGVTLSIEAGATYANTQVVTCTIGTSDGDTTGYEMKLYGDVDTTYDANVQDIEGSSTYFAYATSFDVKLSTGDATKTVYLKVRDDVYNESAEASDTIILDSSSPQSNISVAPDVTKISKISGKDTCSFSFTANEDINEYKVKVVATSGDTHDTGTQIPTTSGSTNMSYTGITITAATQIDCTIKGTDLETASAGDGQKVIKVFVKDLADNWNV